MNALNKARQMFQKLKASTTDPDKEEALRALSTSIIQALLPDYKTEVKVAMEAARQLNVAWTISKGEADHALVKLACMGLVDAIYTHDTDLVVHAVTHHLEQPILLKQDGDSNIKVWKVYQ